MGFHCFADCACRTRLFANIVVILLFWLNGPATVACFAADQSTLQSKKPVDAASTTENAIWRSNRACGANCLYLVLRSKGVDADYSDVQHRLVKKELSSLHDLREVARQYGVELVLCKLTPNGLRATPFPVILHLESILPTGVSRNHFIAVLGLEGKEGSENVAYMDGTTGEIVKKSKEKLLKDWTGFAAYVSRPPPSICSSFVGLLGGVVMGGAIAWTLVRWWTRKCLHSRAVT
jgi:hypothetical protein